jgi:hypothetical protein
MEHDFIDQYKAASNVDLLLVLHKAHQYQETAVEVVRQILQSRSVTADDRIQAQAIIDNETKQRQIKQAKTNRLKSSVANFARNIISTSERTDSQKVQLFSWGLTFLFVFQLFRNSHFLMYYFTHVGQSYYGGFYDTLAILPFIWSPVGIYQLYKRKKWGWIIIAFQFTMDTTGDIWVLLSALLTTRARTFTHLFNPPSIQRILLTLLVHSGVLYYLNSLKFIVLFPVPRKWQVATLVIAFLLTIFSFFILRW